LVLALLLLLVPVVRADEAEDKAVAFVEKLGGKVERDDKKAGKPVVGASLIGTKVGDADLTELSGLQHLQTLDLGSTDVADAGLKWLAGLQQLKELYLNITKVSDAGLKELASLKQLEYLRLSDTKIGDSGLKALAGLQQLQYLELDRTQVTKKGVAELQKALPKCDVHYTAK
jgi:internalin A